MTQKELSLLIAIVILTFVFNFVWENLHLPLFNPLVNVCGVLPWCLYPTTGDVIAVLGIYVAISAIRKNFMWPVAGFRADIVLIMVIGSLIAIVAEWVGISHGFWLYAPAMPIVPLIQIGLTPLLEMTILPVFIFFLAGKVQIRRFH